MTGDWRYTPPDPANVPPPPPPRAPLPRKPLGRAGKITIGAMVGSLLMGIVYIAMEEGGDATCRYLPGYIANEDEAVEGAIDRLVRFKQFRAAENFAHIDPAAQVDLRAHLKSYVRMSGSESREEWCNRPYPRYYVSITRDDRNIIYFLYFAAPDPNSDTYNCRFRNERNVRYAQMHLTSCGISDPISVGITCDCPAKP